MNTKIFSKLALGILIIFASMVANVVLHEVGHFVIADSLELNPSIHLESPVNISESHVVTTPNFAYVSYNSTFANTTLQDALIAAGGPMVNAALALICVAIYLFLPTKSKMISYVLLIFILISALSCVTNLFPIGSSDGAIIFEYLMR